MNEEKIKEYKRKYKLLIDFKKGQLKYSNDTNKRKLKNEINYYEQKLEEVKSYEKY